MTEAVHLRVSLSGPDVGLKWAHIARINQEVLSAS